MNSVAATVEALLEDGEEIDAKGEILRLTASIYSPLRKIPRTRRHCRIPVYDGLAILEVGPAIGRDYVSLISKLPWLSDRSVDRHATNKGWPEVKRIAKRMLQSNMPWFYRASNGKRVYDLNEKLEATLSDKDNCEWRDYVVDLCDAGWPDDHMKLTTETAERWENEMRRFAEAKGVKL